MAKAALSGTFQFGQVRGNVSQIFFTSKLSYGIVNLKPIVPGHVLVLNSTKVSRVADLTAEEASDLFLSAQKVSGVIERAFEGTSLTLAIQDGADAGQSIRHVHFHLIPRRPGDFKRNDDIYAELDIEKERTPRTEEEMAEEARKNDTQQTKKKKKKTR